MIWKIANKPNNFYILMKSTKDDYKLYDPAGNSVNVVSDNPLETDIREFLSTKLEIEVTKAKGGREKVYADETITIIHYENSEKGAKALSEDAKPTKWCSKDYDTALAHVKTNFHIVFENNEPSFVYHYPREGLTIWDKYDQSIGPGTVPLYPTHRRAIEILQKLKVPEAEKLILSFEEYTGQQLQTILWHNPELITEVHPYLYKLNELYRPEYAIRHLLRHNFKILSPYFDEYLDKLTSKDMLYILYDFPESIQKLAPYIYKIEIKDEVDEYNFIRILIYCPDCISIFLKENNEVFDSLAGKDFYEILMEYPQLIEQLSPYLTKITDIDHLAAILKKHYSIVLPYFSEIFSKNQLVAIVAEVFPPLLADFIKAAAQFKSYIGELDVYQTAYLLMKWPPFVSEYQDEWFFPKLSELTVTMLSNIITNRSDGERGGILRYFEKRKKHLNDRTQGYIGDMLDVFY